MVTKLTYMLFAEEEIVKKKRLLMIVILLGLLSVSYAQGLQRSTRLGFSFGILGEMNTISEVTPTGKVVNSFNGNGALISLNLAKHIHNGLWGEIQLGIHALEATSKVEGFKVSNHAVALMPIMLGFRTYFFHNLDTGFQPSLYLLGGPIIGTEAKQEVGWIVTNESHSETTFGAEAGATVDILFFSWFALQLGGGYTFMQDFSTPLNGQVNFNGWHAALGLSFFLGRQH